MSLKSKLGATPEIVRQNLWFINVFDEGQARTEQERREWLVAAGFEGTERVTFLDGRSTITMRTLQTKKRCRRSIVRSMWSYRTA